MLVGGFARSVEAQQLLRTGWAQPLALERDELRARAGSRSPAPTTTAWTATRSLGRRGCRARRTGSCGTRWRRTRARPDAAHGLRRHARLRQVPHPGPVRCVPGAAGHPLRHRAARAVAGAAPRRSAWACPECGERGLRAPVVGEARTAEELGRAFPGAVVRMSAGDRVLTEVDASPAVVVATPGAEPVADGGYAAVVLLDTWLTLGLDHLRADEEALRRWSNAVGCSGRAAGPSRSATPPTRRCRRLSAGTTPASPSARPRRAVRRTCRRPPGSPR